MLAASNAIRLLIIDDDLLVRTLAAESLKAAGFEVAEAGDGTSGLAQVDSFKPDLILLDVVMPGMDGNAVCRTLRACPKSAHIPVIMLTGLDDTASIERAYESGATDFITKPINAALLKYRVRYSCRASRMLDEIDRHRASLANAQRIARLGSWTWRPASAHFECSAQYQHVIGGHELTRDHPWRAILPHVNPEDSALVAKAMDVAESDGEGYSIVYRISHLDGSERTLHEQAEVFCDADGSVSSIEGTTQDITERVRSEERIRQLADYDGLTGLANRRLFGEVMQHGLGLCKREKTNAAVLDININRFKRVNETLGHAAGDRILQDVSQRIVECIRASDLAGTLHDTQQNDVYARMNGDGFAVFLANLRRTEDAVLIARRVIEAIAHPIQHEELELTLTANVGIAVYPDNGDDVGTLLRNAESARYSAKAQGAGTYCFFTPAMNACAAAKLDTEHALRRSIERGELLLFYQPRVDVQSGQLVGAEALVRWQDAQRGLVPPAEFIPVAEECGLIVPMTECAIARLDELRSIGIKIAMDDFGTGYSSLAQLKRLPLDVLKIDRAFVNDLLTSTHDVAIASTIVALGEAIGVAVVAEGIEHVAQAKVLLGCGCRLMQGYLFSRPLPADKFATLLSNGIAVPSELQFERSDRMSSRRARAAG